MRRSLLLVLSVVLAWSGIAQAELLGIGGGLAAYPLDLRGPKAGLERLGVSPEDLANIPDLLPLPHVSLRGRVGLPILISGVQLDVAWVSFNLPIDEEMGLTAGLDSTAIGFSLLGKLEALLVGLILGVGADLVQGELGISSHQPETEALLEQTGLDSLAWSVATIHVVGELELILGPLRLYLEGKYLYPVRRSGLGIGSWMASLGLLIVIFS